MKVAVIIPCYKVKRHILDVISKIGNEINIIYVVDDCCPEQTGIYVQDHCKDFRVNVLFNSVNLGVGGAVIRGYNAAIKDDIDICIKIDGDGQMDPDLIPLFIDPIISGDVDYTKGNRFYNIETLRRMPKIRLIGNAILSFMTKFSSGYYQVFDPTNGYTAISVRLLERMSLEKISKRYFFESDMLFRLNIMRGRVIDIPMDAVYNDEQSNLKIKNIIFPFIIGNVRNSFKRIYYNYFLRGFSIASLELLVGSGLFFMGLIGGVGLWLDSIKTNDLAPNGTISLVVLMLILGIQFLLSFLQYDITNEPKLAISKKLLSKNYKKAHKPTTKRTVRG